MAVAFRTKHLGPDHAVADVALLVDVALHRRLGKARPAAAGIELGVGFEQRLPAAGADVGAGALLMLIFAGERPLGRLLAQHRILHRRQFLAPLRLALLDLAGHGSGVGHGASLLNVFKRRSSPALIRGRGTGSREDKAPTNNDQLANNALVSDLRAAYQRRLLDVVVREKLLQVLDLRNVVVGNIGLVRVQRQVILMIGFLKTLAALSWAI